MGHSLLQRAVLLGHPQLTTDLGIQTTSVHVRRALTEKLAVDDSGLPAWMVVGIIIMSLLLLFCLKWEW